MGAQTFVRFEEYMTTSYSPDREFRDGVLMERNLGEKAHSQLQGALAAYAHWRRRQWGIDVYISLRVRVRDGWYAVPDVCLYSTPFQGRYPSQPPLVWIEILSDDDRMVDVWAKATELIANGVPYVWIIDPTTLESELWTSSGAQQLADKTLRLPNSPIMIPLLEAIEE